MMALNVPELRFPEFNGEWEGKPFGNICQIKKSKYNPENEKESLKCIELEHLSQNTGKILGYCDSKGQNSIKNRFEKGDVLFGKLRPYLRKYWLAKFDGVCSSEIWVFDGKEISNDFLFQLIQSNKFNYISNISSGSKMPRSDWKYMKHVKFKIPSLTEQEKTASFLSKIDEKIEKLEKKQELWETYKKGMMQKIFSQELRFKDENGENFLDWEEKKLVDMLKLIRNGFSGNQVNHVTNFPVTRIETISSGKINFNKVGYVSKIDKSYKLQEGDILISNINSVQHIGKLAYFNSEKPLYHGMNLLLLRFNKNYDKRFLYYFLSFYKKWFEKMCCQAVNQASINQDTIKKFPAIIPKNIGEQQKISDFLLVTENKIAKTEYELKLFNNFKKGLLQQMFI